jgi:hypothetical protein
MQPHRSDCNCNACEFRRPHGLDTINRGRKPFLDGTTIKTYEKAGRPS